MPRVGSKPTFKGIKTCGIMRLDPSTLSKNTTQSVRSLSGSGSGSGGRAIWGAGSAKLVWSGTPWARKAA